MRHELLVDEAHAGARLDLFVGEALKLSRSRVKALLEAGHVRVDGRTGRKGHPVTAGQRVSVEYEEEKREALADPSLALTVLFEDEALIFVEKPAGVPSHPLNPGELGTVGNALVARYPELVQAGADPREAGLVHRLDVETSGVLLAARTRKSWDTLRGVFSGESGQLDKRYLALVTGPLADQGEIELPLAHHGDHVRTALGAADGRAARSEFEVLARKGEYALVKVRIFTGVLHQVRAHLAAVGAPIVGDTLYGGRPIEGLHRFFLHAARLTVPHPVTGQAVSVESPLPPELEQVRARLLD